MPRTPAARDGSQSAFDPDVQLGSFNIQQMSTVLAVIGNEMKVVSRDTERTRKSRRPQADQRPVDVSEAELTLGLGRVDKARARRRWIDRARADTPEVPVQSDRV